ncbi:MAG: hypothetical protein HC834_06560 [Rhodospirillales bacterium]|nr:hypothetical protein [Rhodospirillales bacterium]
MLTRRENLAARADLPGPRIGAVHDRRSPKGVTLDMDISESPVLGDQGEQPGTGTINRSACNPLFVFNQLEG